MHKFERAGTYSKSVTLDNIFLGTTKNVLFCFFSFDYHLHLFQVIAEKLSEEEIAGLREMFKMIDTDNSGQITFDELKAGLKRVGANLKESEIYDLMQAVSISLSLSL